MKQKLAPQMAALLAFAKAIPGVGSVKPGDKSDPQDSPIVEFWLDRELVCLQHLVANKTLQFVAAAGSQEKLIAYLNRRLGFRTPTAITPCDPLAFYEWSPVSADQIHA